MRITLLLLAALFLGGCKLTSATAIELLKAAVTSLDSRGSEKPKKQDDSREKQPRTEKDLSEEASKSTRTTGHARIDLHGGAFTDSDLNEEYDGAWGIAASVGVFVQDHISVGGLLDWTISTGEGERQISSSRRIEVDLTMNLITFAPMVWFHSTSPEATTSKLRPDFMVGIGPAVVWAEEEATWGSWILSESTDDDSDVGFGFLVEAAVEFPVSDRLTLSLGGRYTSVDLDEYEVNAGTISGFAGIGVRF